MAENLKEMKVDSEMDELALNEKFIEAVRSKNKDEVKRLLAFKEVNVNYRNKNGDSAAHVAAYVNDEEMMQLLIDNTINIQLTDANNDVPITVAIMHNNFDLVETLVVKFKIDLPHNFAAMMKYGYNHIYLSEEEKQKNIAIMHGEKVESPQGSPNNKTTSPKTTNDNSSSSSVPIKDVEDMKIVDGEEHKEDGGVVRKEENDA